MEDMTEADDLEANEFFIKPPLQRQAKSVNVVWLLFMRLARHVWRHPEITIFRLLWLVFTAVCIGTCVGPPLPRTQCDGNCSLARPCALRVCVCAAPFSSTALLALPAVPPFRDAHSHARLNANERLWGFLWLQGCRS
jgi:hypothetical protein